jgi:hypothetical protein
MAPSRVVRRWEAREVQVCKAAEARAGDPVTPSLSRMHLPTLGLALASLALAATACADVGGADKPAGSEATGPPDSVICTSIRTAMLKDKAAAETAETAGDTAEAGRRRQAVLAGAEGAKSVKDCDTSDIVPVSAPPSP